MVATRCNEFTISTFVNSPVPSNAYLITHLGSGHCILIDPGSKDAHPLLDYIENKGLTLDYIILTHEHFDHCWGVNDIIQCLPAKLISTKKAKEYLRVPMNYFNKLYFDSDEMFCIDHVDYTVEELEMRLEWQGKTLLFIESKGHTDKSMCIYFNSVLFSGDTLIYNTKPHIKKKYGASLEDFEATIQRLFSKFDPATIVYPGHGKVFQLGEMKDYYHNFFTSASMK